MTNDAVVCNTPSGTAVVYVFIFILFSEDSEHASSEPKPTPKPKLMAMATTKSKDFNPGLLRDPGCGDSSSSIDLMYNVSENLGGEDLLSLAPISIVLLLARSDVDMYN